MSFSKPKLKLKNDFMFFNVVDKLGIDTFFKTARAGSDKSIG